MRIRTPGSLARAVSLVVALLALAIIPAAASAAPKKVFFRLSASAYSASEGAGAATVTVARSGNTHVAATVHYATSDGATGTPPAATAVAGVQYTATSGTLSFAAGQTRRQFAVPVADNSTFDPPNKRFTVTISAPDAGTAATQIKPPAKAVVTILDNDGPGTIDLSSTTYSVVEDAGAATITVTRDGAANIVESVDYATSGGTATAGSDYETATGTVTFGSGEMSKTFQVPIDDDNSFESGLPETVDIALSNPQNLSDPILGDPVLGPNTPATLSIVDDDVPTFSFSSSTYQVAEAETTFDVTVTRGGDTSIAASIGYSDDGTGTATAGVGNDYQLAAGTLSFAAGQTSKTFPVTIHNDALAEGNETVGLQLTQGSTQVATALLSIVDNDDIDSPSVQFSDVSYDAGESDGTVQLTVTLSEPAAGGETVHYATADDTAAAGSDYVAATGTLTFLAGETSRTIDVTIDPDSVQEDDETFTATLSSPSGLVLGDPHDATVTIRDDDGAGVLAFSALRYDASETSGHATITIRRSGGSAGVASVDYATSDGTAHAPGDYSAASGTLTFGDGETTKTFDIPVAWDGRGEGDETVSINLSNFDSDDDPDATKAAVLHVADDGASGPVQFTAASYEVAETAGAATITVTRSGGSLGGPVTVDYAGTDGTNGTLTFGPGEASQAFQVPVVDDKVHTGTRTVGLSLSNPGGGTSLGGQSAADLRIADDEPASSASTDRTAPKLTLTAKKRQRALKTRRLVLKVRSNETAKLRIRASVRAGKKRVRVAKGAGLVGAGRTVTIRLKLSKKALATLRTALVKGRAKVTFAVTGTDAAGNRATVRRTVTVR